MPDGPIKKQFVFCLISQNVGSVFLLKIQKSL